jgi:hypothetical protein
MSGLITMRFFIDDVEAHSETVPHDRATIESLERSVAIEGYGTHELKVRIEFDPPVECPSPRESVDAE